MASLRRAFILCIAVPFAFLVAPSCTTPGAGDAGTDAGTAPVDAGSADAGTPDAGVPDAGVHDAGVVGVICEALADAGVPDLGDACGVCVATSCCTQIAACATDDLPSDGGLSPCALLVECGYLCVADGGSTTSCLLSCTSKHHDGTGDALGVLECVRDSCSESCPQLSGQ